MPLAKTRATWCERSEQVRSLERPWRFQRLKLACSGVLFWIYLGCGPGGSTPVPQPPVSAIPAERVSTQLAMGGSPSGEREPPFFVGAPESAPAGAIVRATNLDVLSPTALAAATRDGSFVLRLPVNEGDEIRLDWLTDSVRSPPTDVVVTIGASPSGVALARRFDCLALTPGFSLSFDTGSEVLDIRNGCAAAISVSNARLRSSLRDYSVSSALPLLIEPGETGQIAVDFTRSEIGRREDILFLDISQGAELIRYPITVTTPP